MLTEPLIQQLHDLRLKGMAASLEQQLSSTDTTARSFEDRLGLMIQHEITERSSYRLAQRLRWAKLPMSACLEDLDTCTARGVDPAQLAQLTDLAWIKQHLNVLLTGPTGVGKSYLAAALAHAACRGSSMNSPATARCRSVRRCSSSSPVPTCSCSMTSVLHPCQIRPCATC